MNSMRVFQVIFLTILMGTGAVAHAVEPGVIFTWVDERGVAHIADREPQQETSSSGVKKIEFFAQPPLLEEDGVDAGNQNNATDTLTEGTAATPNTTGGVARGAKSEQDTIATTGTMPSGVEDAEAIMQARMKAEEQQAIEIEQRKLLTSRVLQRELQGRLQGYADAKDSVGEMRVARAIEDLDRQIVAIESELKRLDSRR